MIQYFLLSSNTVNTPPPPGRGTPLCKQYRWAFLVWKWVYTGAILVWNRVWFQGNYIGVWMYLSCQLQMNKNKIECEFEMHLKNFFCLRSVLSIDEIISA